MEICPKFIFNNNICIAVLYSILELKSRASPVFVLQRHLRAARQTCAVGQFEQRRNHGEGEEDGDGTAALPDTDTAAYQQRARYGQPDDTTGSVKDFIFPARGGPVQFGSSARCGSNGRRPLAFS